MLSLRFHHLGVAVPDIDRAIPVYQDVFGYGLQSGPFEDPIEQAAVCFLGTGKPGDILIELVAPLGESSPVKKVLDRGSAAYHVCYEVSDVDQAMAELRRKGWIVVHAPVRAVAFKGRRITWLYTPTRQLIELLEA